MLPSVQGIVVVPGLIPFVGRRHDEEEEAPSERCPLLSSSKSCGCFCLEDDDDADVDADADA